MGSLGGGAGRERAELRRPPLPPQPLLREPPGPQPSQAALMNETRQRQRQRPSVEREARGPRPGHVTPRCAAPS